MSTAEGQPGQREFRCEHCDGKILIPRDLPPTTGPCPHCGKEITSPAPEDDPAADPIFGERVEVGPEASAQPAPPLPQAGRVESPLPPVPPAADDRGEGSPGGSELPPIDAPREVAPEAPAPEPAAKGPDDALSGLSGERSTEVDEHVEPKPKKSGGKSRARKLVLPLAVLAVLVLLAVGVAMFVVPALRGGGDASGGDQARAAALREQQYLEGGWEDEAREVLDAFLTADTAAGKAAYSIRGAELLPRMNEFYGGGRIDDSDTPMEAFAPYPLAMEDRKRGIFMMVFDQPPVFELSEFFAPIAPLRVQYGVSEPDLLLAAVGRRGNFTGEAMAVHALFKRGPEGLRLDWETFVQTKYRLLRDFLEIREPGRAEVFRVIMSETVPDKDLTPQGYRTYLVADPAHRTEDRVKIDVAGDSDHGQALSILNWRGTRESRVISKTATVELRWSEEEPPQLELSEFICWEFLGLGGEAVPASE